LSELVGLSHADIASVLGRREPAVKALVFQARAVLSDWREARETPCEAFRTQMSTLRRGGLRRRSPKRHLELCSSCRAYRTEMRTQRRKVAALFPVFPSFGVKRLLAVFGLGGSTGGDVSGAGTGDGLGAAALGSTRALTLAAVGVLLRGGPN